MSNSLDALEKRRADLLGQIRQLGDFRPGSISTTTGRCGNPGCHCHTAGATGHGPNFRLTYKIHGKTVTESFPSEVARRKAAQETEEFRRWQELSREFVAVNTSICRLRPVEETLTAEEKKRPPRSSRKWRKR